MINRQYFYDSVRQSLFGGKLTQSQVQGIDTILNEWESNHSFDNIKWLAYILASAYHEVNKTMQPIEENGKGKGMDYGKKLDIGAGPGKRVPYTSPDKLYYGRGLCQLTWRSNYKKMGEILGVDLLNNPELALDDKIATKIIFTGMYKGFFTGKKLSDYINNNKTDYFNARRIINSIDRAQDIATYAEKFEQALAA